MRSKNIRNLTLTALFLAIGMILPFVTMNVPYIGNLLSPMHLPVMLCGLICGPMLGGLLGFFLPLIRSLTLGMPPFFPNAVSMAFELAAYGIIIGLIYQKLRPQNVRSVYLSLIIAMILGRLVWGIARVVMLGVMNTPFSFSIFITSGFITAIPAIIIQLILIPLVMEALDRSHLIPYLK